MAIFRNRQVERMKLRKKTRGEADCFLKMKELLKGATESLEQSFNVKKREQTKFLTDIYSEIALDKFVENAAMPACLRQLGRSDSLQEFFLMKYNEL